MICASSLRLDGRPTPALRSSSRSKAPSLPTGGALLAGSPLEHRRPRVRLTASSPLPRREASLPAGVAYAHMGHIAIGVGLAIGAAAFLVRRLLTAEPSIAMKMTSGNLELLRKSPSLQEKYAPPLFLSGGHIETIFAALYRRDPKPEYRRELLTTEDGGTVALDWLDCPQTRALPEDAPALILVPGLGGASSCATLAYMAMAAAARGMRTLVFNCRGTGDAPVTTAQFYSASYTDDMRAVVQHVQKELPGAPLLAAGWSLGANILTCYLGEEGRKAPLAAAASLANPFNLTISTRSIEKGFNKVYDRRLGSSLVKILEANVEMFKQDDHGGRTDWQKGLAAKTIREFDEAITVGTFGWDSVEEYYAGSSSCRHIPRVRVPLLCIQAWNDPIAPASAIPKDAIKQNPNCMLVTTKAGGHLGWMGGPGGIRGEPWTHRGVLEYFLAVLEKQEQRAALFKDDVEFKFGKA